MFMKIKTFLFQNAKEIVLYFTALCHNFHKKNKFPKEFSRNPFVYLQSEHPSSGLNLLRKLFSTPYYRLIFDFFSIAYPEIKIHTHYNILGSTSLLIKRQVDQIVWQIVLHEINITQQAHCTCERPILPKHTMTTAIVTGTPPLKPTLAPAHLS